MILPGCLAISVPIAVGAIIGAEALGGLLLGSIVAGRLMALMMANAGGAWDNAKKYIEAGHLGGKAPRLTRLPSSVTPLATPSRTPRACAQHPPQADVRSGGCIRPSLRRLENLEFKQEALPSSAGLLSYALLQADYGSMRCFVLAQLRLKLR